MEPRGWRTWTMKPSNGSILIISRYKELTDHPHDDNELSNDWNEFVCVCVGGGGGIISNLLYISPHVFCPHP